MYDNAFLYPLTLVFWGVRGVKRLVLLYNRANKLRNRGCTEVNEKKFFSAKLKQSNFFKE